MNLIQKANVRLNAASVSAAGMDGKIRAYYGTLAGTGAAVGATHLTCAANDGLNQIFGKISQSLADVYSAVLTISTAVAVTLVGVCLLIRMFSKNQRSVEEATQWIKRIVITWVILNLMSFFVKYFQDLTDGAGAVAW